MKKLAELYGFYARELKENILAFWLPRCRDSLCGGYLNCFDNSGEHLVSHDKYTWSQGRFLWLFSSLATTGAPLFSQSERKSFLELAEYGYSFLRKHCLIAPDDLRCVFLTGRDGTPKQGDMSIYADCFVVMGMAAYAVAAKEKDAYSFAKSLYLSVKKRIDEGLFNTLPYPLGKEYRAHGIPMILTNTALELYKAACIFDPDYCSALLHHMEDTATEVTDRFSDTFGLVREVIRADGKPLDGLLGNHINPGHSIEDSWFIAKASELTGRPYLFSRAAQIMQKSFHAGWDDLYGGILHFVNIEGDPYRFESDSSGPTVELVKNGWADKLWWVHSETLYASLLFYVKTGDCEFLDIHNKTREYVFDHFPNRNPLVGEWFQILTREGKPQEKVVALPVKDPYHIARNFLLVCELLSGR